MSMETDRIEADVQQSRHRLKDTLTELSSKLSPGQLLDEGIGLVQGTAGQFAGKLGRQVRDNPLPVLLIGAGIGWLVFSNRQSARDTSEVQSEDEYHARRYRTIEEARWATPRMPGETDETYEERVHESYVKALDLKQLTGEAANDFKARVKRTVEGIQYAATRAGGRVKRTFTGTGRRLGGGLSATRDRLGGAYTGAREKLGTLASDAKHVAEEQAHRLAETARHAGERTGRFYEESPLAVGALALALGALIGAAAPLSQPERRTLRGVADKAAGAGADLLERGARAVEERLDGAVH